MKEDKKLKFYIVLQSFFPLFILLFIQHAGHWNLIRDVFFRLLHGDFSVLGKVSRNVAGDIGITFFCLAWFLFTAVAAAGFRDLQKENFDSHGERILIKKEKTGSGASFLVSFVLPLLIDDVSTRRGFTMFVALLIMLVFLLWKSDLFYQNPVLVVLGYKIFEFQFISPHNDVNPNKTYIGMSKNSLPIEGEIIKRRYIADNIFLVYND